MQELAKKWTLVIVSETSSPAEPSSSQHDTFEEALALACNPPSLHHKAIRIEGPNGEKIEADEIEKLCLERRASSS